MITDDTGRTFKSLRVSLTNVCNLSCLYCVSGQKDNTTKTPLLNHQEYFKLIRNIHLQTPLETVRLTGGEPLLYKEILPLIEKLKSLGVKVKLTTNALLLKEKLHDLMNAGIDNINVSFDAVNPKIHYEISRSKKQADIVEAIDIAVNTGVNLKLNSVILKGINDQEVLPLLDFAGERGIVIRFLELMNMGYLHYNSKEFLYSKHDILQQISQKYKFLSLPREVSATAEYWQTYHLQVFGIIANESAPFCSDCNRLRMDSSGNIYGCISNAQGVNIKESDENELAAQLKFALSQKQRIRFTGSALSMKHIGG